MNANQLKSDIRKRLLRVADSKKAPEMQAYMKSKMSYAGVSSPQLKLVTKEAFKDLKWKNSKEWSSAVLTLWRKAQFREERYAAISLARHTSARAFQKPEALKIYKEMIISGAWWDYIDVIASHLVGPLVREYPEKLRPVMLRWAKDKNLWICRTAILCQLSSGREVDLSFLYQCIEPSMESSEFFLQKAAGWALRQVAWYNPREVKKYVKKNQNRLSRLTVREALKNI